MATSTNTTTDLNTDELVASYMGMERKNKAGFRAGLNQSLKDAVRSGEFQTAANVQAVLDAIDAASKASTKAPVDYAQMVADQIATLELAITQLHTGIFFPEGVTVDMSDLPAGMADEKTAAKLATITARKSNREGVIPFIEEALADTNGEWVTVSKLAKFTGSTTRTSAPSTGALGAAIARVADGTAEADFEVGTDEKGRIAVRIA